MSVACLPQEPLPPSRQRALALMLLAITRRDVHLVLCPPPHPTTPHPNLCPPPVVEASHPPPLPRRATQATRIATHSHTHTLFGGGDPRHSTSPQIQVFQIRASKLHFLWIGEWVQDPWAPESLRATGQYGCGPQPSVSGVGTLPSRLTLVAEKKVNIQDYGKCQIWTESGFPDGFCRQVHRLVPEIRKLRSWMVFD